MDPFVQSAVDDMVAARDELDASLAGVDAADWARHVPYSERTLHELLAHVATADQAWALAAQGLLKGEGEQRLPPTPEEMRGTRGRAIERGRRRGVAELRDEMSRRRRLLLSLYELLEPRHLALPLRSFGPRHNSVRERIWVGWHDRRHSADVRRALRMRWHPPRLRFLAAVQPAVDALSPDETLYVIFSVDPVNWEMRSPVPEWTFRELLAHIATGDWVFQTHLRSLIERGRVADAPVASPQVAAGNATLVRGRQQSPHATLTEEYLSMRHETLRLLASLGPKDLAQPFTMWWEADAPTRTVLDYVLFFPAHEATHREQLRPAMRYVRAAGAA
jgi:uncharacterized damage-inducible protein DinB